MTNPIHRTLKGEFREDRVWSARGVLRHPDGAVDEGQWEKGELTGHCKRTYPDGAV
jgi:hypothetical protein